MHDDNPISRRHALAVGTMMIGTVLFSGCTSDIVAPLEPEQPLLNALSGGGRITIAGPTSTLRHGQRITIVGRAVNASGKPLGNTLLGVHDGLGLQSTTVRTNSVGRFEFSTIVRCRGAALVEFVLGGSRSAFTFQARRAESAIAHSALLGSILVRNPTRRDVTVRLITTEGVRMNAVVRRGTSRTVLRVRREITRRVTTYGGVTLQAGPSSASTTVDSTGAVIISATTGLAIYRGTLYANSRGALGACWAPGGGAGAATIAIAGEVAVCFGSDGMSIGAGGSLAGHTAGFSIEIF